jgi:hypothetical protein
MPHEMSYCNQFLKTGRVTAYKLTLILRVLEMHLHMLLEDVFRGTWRSLLSCDNSSLPLQVRHIG